MQHGLVPRQFNKLPLSPLLKEGGGGVKFSDSVLKDDRMRANKGQSTVEYILLVTAVLVAIILFTTGKNSPFQKSLNSVFNSTTTDMVNVANRLQNAL